MKILAGKYKGRNFYMPAGIRPTQSILRGAIFDILGHDLCGLSFLELFAGSGAVGLEAISRGAGQVVMVEINDLNAKTIQENCELLGIGLGGEFSLLHAEALTTIKRFSEEKRRFDIVFLDPPFGRKLAKKALKLITSRDILHPQSLLLVQCEAAEKLEIPECFGILTRRRYGSSYLTLLQRVQK
ncbi:MAG: 16S rRNA (guanine(966)-N(2))-methyltransferase RsmD [Candidatus Omnitrophica bacterium]|nr:16S rRNA (guanine(966)-N(2))-methyltransferase RsmD [Candidatus Omnitrophota bacterium]MDE2215433.1 16S rRNA (guanine(966)-N(2))-methyltransferase RsmD [Candidatus Omnitrophota bacterium]